MSDTHKMSGNPSYGAFGTRLAELRRQAGIALQADLAASTGTSQQTISRWEAGTSRPRASQIPRLARAIGVKPKDLLVAAGYAPRIITVPFDKPFPVDALSPDSFERFCQYFLESRYRDATVNAIGGPGHAQEGADIDVIFRDGIRHTFQCKRESQFGPEKVHKAVTKHIRQATKKIILLSRIASPKAREAVRLHPDWDIWDKEDISRRVRELPTEQQVRLVNVFFPEQRFALLGDTADGRWQTAEEFFAPYMAGHGAFSHDWPLVGRAAELTTLLGKFHDEEIKVILVTASGGAGKTRVLKEAIEKYQGDHKGLIIRFLSPTQDATRDSLDELGKDEKLLVVDDAHDRTDLPLLYQYVSAPENNARLVLSIRPYGLDHIKFQASNFGLAGDAVSELPLRPLDIAQATALATQVLERFGGPTKEAEAIARLTLDCSLATVIGAQVIASGSLHFELAKNEELFRSTLLGKFQDIIAGRVGGSKSDAEAVRKVLRVIALVQPFYPEDKTIPDVVAAVEGLEAHEVSRLLRTLTEAGVLFKRGGQYRLSPDLLADHIIEQACIGIGGASTGYAEKVFAAAGDRHIEHILLNLGKLDWRRANGRPTNSGLLDGIWGQLTPSSDYSDPHIKAVTAVAYFQPERALAFAENQIRAGRYLRELPELIKYAAYTYEHIPRACECLWELGKSDTRELGSHPHHPIRILSELCEVRPNKPLSYNEAIVDFGLSLLRRDDAWTQRYSPLDILKGMLHPEGHTTKSNAKSFTITKFGVNPVAVSALRTKVVNAVIDILSSANIKAAALAAQLLHEALRYPMDADETARQEWTKEFVQTLTKIQQTIQVGNIDPLVVIEVARAISWHAHHGPAETRAASLRTLRGLPRSLEFRTLLTLVDAYGQLLIERHANFEAHQAWWKEHISELVAELLRAYPDGEALRGFVEQQIAHIKSNSPRASFSPNALYYHLIVASPTLARATLANALAVEGSVTASFAATALAKLVQSDRAEATGYIQRFLQSASHELHAAVATAFGLFGPEELPLASNEIDMLRRLLGSGDVRVARSAVGAVRVIAKGDQRLAIDLLKNVRVGMSNELADDVFMNFAEFGGGDLFSAVTADDVDTFLTNLMPLAELEGHWIECFLSKVSGTHAIRLAKFFMQRVDHAAENENWDYLPCNHGPYGNVALRLRDSDDFGLVLRQVSEWIKSRSSMLFRERSAQLFDTLFKPFDDMLTTALQRWADIATEEDIQVIAKILSEAHPRFVFEQRTFVARFLDRARQFGKDSVKHASSELFRSAISGGRSGIPGEPFPQDIEMKREANKALAELPRFSPAFSLYESIAQYADWGIKMSLRDAEAFEE
jgi:transcriptional regulator with XRE-family HTH domain